MSADSFVRIVTGLPCPVPKMESCHGTGLFLLIIEMSADSFVRIVTGLPSCPKKWRVVTGPDNFC